MNLGGIAKSTILSPNKQVIGFDHGPANCLMDAWVKQHHLHQYFDDKGQWASQDVLHTPLLNQFIKDPYFERKPPKSAGKEYFNLNWLHQHLQAETFAIISSMNNICVFLFKKYIYYFIF
ncbi:MAG: hypothetical protein HAW62_02230 [Endozoicomonadaceae bacterium]|nr:hypothetical protein [Endozoicomonadaceae bacterium]